MLSKSDNTAKCYTWQCLIVQGVNEVILGPKEPPTIYHYHHKGLAVWKRYLRGWCTNCQNLREKQNTHHTQDCTGDVYHFRLWGWGWSADCGVRDVITRRRGTARVQLSCMFFRGRPFCSEVLCNFLSRLFRWLGCPLSLRLKWPFTEWETGPEQKSRKNGKENGKWPHAWNGRKMAAEMEKWPKSAQNPMFGSIFHFGGHFSAISGVGPFSIFFPIFPGFLLRARFPFCKWPLQSQL